MSGHPKSPLPPKEFIQIWDARMEMVLSTHTDSKEIYSRWQQALDAIWICQRKAYKEALLNEIRTKTSLTQKQIAKAIQFSEAAVSALNDGGGSEKVTRKLEEVYGSTIIFPIPAERKIQACLETTLFLLTPKSSWLQNTSTELDRESFEYIRRLHNHYHWVKAHRMGLSQDIDNIAATMISDVDESLSTSIHFWLGDENPISDTRSLTQLHDLQRVYLDYGPYYALVNDALSDYFIELSYCK